GSADVEVDDARAALALIAANFYGRPAEKLSLVGVTGTSGKTTTTKMIESIFDAAAKETGEAVGLIGTIEYRAGDEVLSADRTTPDAVVLQEWFAKMRDAGVRNAVMEVSSHALALKRTYGIGFAAAVFTNLSRDHFDFHKDFDDYFAAKRILFDQIPGGGAAVVNRDDEYGRRLIAELGDAVTFGMKDADITPDVAVNVRGLHGVIRTPQGDVRIESQLLGQPNLYNWMAAVGAALIVGVPIDAIERGIRNLQSVRGRFERVATEHGPTVIVDYAHKPDALEKLLRAVRELAPRSELVLLFGCGGDRDKGKRPQMGEIASRLADRVIVTSDNPRGEQPQAIIDEIVRGISSSNYETIADRRAAIRTAIDRASDDQVIVIAGKGHETYQVVGDRILHFDDKEEAELALKKRAHKTVPNSV
ncbi:MAG TPA: UDP-N-acetylmuramoyl-L-alanyl-D-glutamate--2,6-diaminopimelate ligase, partial [Thermoanaerobaculia bacterium]|nr:UDP-N-acetylmuramoyl-L-alanyl-D-glutamate--2,6-diaminopimelate ligase [Thermoanaerobaculia bacterium]